MDKLKWSGTSSLAINKAGCRVDRVYACFNWDKEERFTHIFIEN